MISVSPSESGRSGSRTRKGLSPPTGFQPMPGTNREALPLSLNASTRTRTQNIPLEAGHDLHFTIEALQKRKARDSNPHLPRGRAALAVRSGQPYPATFRILHSSVDPPGVEPALFFSLLKTGRHAIAVSCRWTMSPFFVVSGPPGS